MILTWKQIFFLFKNPAEKLQKLTMSDILFLKRKNMRIYQKYEAEDNLLL